MTEEQKEALKEKLKKFFDEKLDSLTNKFQADVNELETLKYSYFDNVVLPYREMEESGTHENEIEEPKEKEKEKAKEEKKEKIQELTKLNVTRPKTATREKLSKTPFKSNKTKEIGFKDKTENIPKKTTKIFAGKKNQKSEPAATQPNEGAKRKTITTVETNKKSAANRPSKTPFSTRGRKGDAGTTPAPKTKNSKGTAIKTTTTKKFTKGKAGDKKGKPEKKKKEAEEAKEEEVKEEVVEEKKPIVLKDKSINKIPDELKANNALVNLYFVSKGKYLNNKEKYKLILSNPSIYKSFGSDVKFLLDDKKNELKNKIKELESFLNNYGDLQNILAKEFNPSKTAQNSLVFVKKEEIENIIKKGKIAVEINNVFKILLYLFDEPFDESLENENLLNFFVNEIMVNKYNAKDLKTIALNYISKHKDLNNSKEKYDKIEAIISLDKKYVSSVDMAKIHRIVSYCTLLIKECHEFLNLKTSDNVPYYEFKYKSKMLQEYKNKLAILENNGVPPENKKEKKDEPQKENNDNEKKEEKAEEKKEEKKEEKEEEKKEEKKEEPPKVEEETVTKEKEE